MKHFKGSKNHFSLQVFEFFILKKNFFRFFNLLITKSKAKIRNLLINQK